MKGFQQVGLVDVTQRDEAGRTQRPDLCEEDA